MIYPRYMKNYFACLIGLFCISDIQARSTYYLPISIQNIEGCSDFKLPKQEKKIVIQSASDASFRPIVFCFFTSNHSKLEYHPFATTLYLPAKEYSSIEYLFLKNLFRTEASVDSLQRNYAPVVKIECYGCGSKTNTKLLNRKQAILFFQDLSRQSEQDFGISRSAAKKIKAIINDIYFRLGVNP